MPHPVGGAMGVTLCTAAKRSRGETRFDVNSLNVHKTTSLRAGICMAVVLRPRLLTSACLTRHPANCSKALSKVFSSDLPGCQYIDGRSPCGLHKLCMAYSGACTHNY